MTIDVRASDLKAAAVEYPSPDDEEARREYILSELRCAAARARLAALDIDAVGQALRARIISPNRAASLLWDTDAVHYLGIKGAQ